MTVQIAKENSGWGYAIVGALENMAQSHAVLANVFTSIMETFRARGFGRSEPSMPMVKQLSATSCLISDTAIRYNRDGAEMDRAGVTCVLQKTNAGWKIAVAVLHDVQET